jgi:hypothetical protein
VLRHFGEFSRAARERNLERERFMQNELWTSPQIDSRSTQGQRHLLSTPGELRSIAPTANKMGVVFR